MKLYYYITHGSCLKFKSIQRELERIANFIALPPEKVISRVKKLHMFSSSLIHNFSEGLK